MNTNLTIIVPTYNRYSYLKECINSIQNIFDADIQIIICDSSSISYKKNHILDISLYCNIKYLYFPEYENNLYMIYKKMLSYVQTQYILIVEDDDILLNRNLHLNILDKYLCKSKYDCISFAAKTTNEYFLNTKFKFNKNNKKSILTFWNGNFQFGQMYFSTKIFKTAFETWFHNKPEHTFIGTTDEAIALISIYLNNNYFHINSVGLWCRIHNLNMSWNNFAFSLFSSHSYIDELTEILNEDNSWNKLYKEIQLRELKTMCSKVDYNGVFNNQFLIKLNKKIHNLLKTTTEYNKQYIYLKSILVKYIKIVINNMS